MHTNDQTVGVKYGTQPVYFQESGCARKTAVTEETYPPSGRRDVAYVPGAHMRRIPVWNKAFAHTKAISSDDGVGPIVRELIRRDLDHPNIDVVGRVSVTGINGAHVDSEVVGNRPAVTLEMFMQDQRAENAGIVLPARTGPSAVAQTSALSYDHARIMIYQLLRAVRYLRALLIADAEPWLHAVVTEALIPGNAANDTFHVVKLSDFSSACLQSITSSGATVSDCYQHINRRTNATIRTTALRLLDLVREDLRPGVPSPMRGRAMTDFMSVTQFNGNTTPRLRPFEVCIALLDFDLFDTEPLSDPAFLAACPRDVPLGARYRAGTPAHFVEVALPYPSPHQDARPFRDPTGHLAGETDIDAPSMLWGLIRRDRRRAAATPAVPEPRAQWEAVHYDIATAIITTPAVTDPELLGTDPFEAERIDAHWDQKTVIRAITLGRLALGAIARMYGNTPAAVDRGTVARALLTIARELQRPAVDGEKPAGYTDTELASTRSPAAFLYAQPVTAAARDATVDVAVRILRDVDFHVHHPTAADFFEVRCFGSQGVMPRAGVTTCLQAIALALTSTTYAAMAPEKLSRIVLYAYEFSRPPEHVPAWVTPWAPDKEQDIGDAFHLLSYLEAHAQEARFGRAFDVLATAVVYAPPQN
jgi:hypothetical protein